MQLMIGLVLLFIGGEILIRGAMASARHLNISPLMCGIVIVGFGTSMPELVVSVNAVNNAQPDVALGNVIGSNIGNALLILGLCALIRPMSLNRAALSKDVMGLILATLLCCILMSFNCFTLWTGVMLLAGLFTYIIWLYTTEKNTEQASGNLHQAEAHEISTKTTSVVAMILLIIVGMVMLIVGANLFIKAAITLAQQWQLSSTVIGLSLVAVGTSLPEITISLMATLRKNNDVAIGNVLGSNIFNILGILGITSIIDTIPVTERVFAFDQWVLVGSVAAIVIWVCVLKKITRLSALAALVSYSLYIWFGTVYYNV